MLSSVKANEARFLFSCSNFDPQTFDVVHFSGMDRISCPYLFSITLFSHENHITRDQIIGASSTLYFLRGDRYCTYSGVISRFQILDQNTNYSMYTVQLVPHLWLISLNIQTRIYQKMTVIEIIKKVLIEAEIIDSVIFMVDDRNALKYPKLEYVVQYQESDLNFISRLMENVGLWYFFQEESFPKEQIGLVKCTEKIVITDAVSNFAAIESPCNIIYSPPSGMVEQDNRNACESIKNIHQTDSVIPKEVVVRNYNYRTPDCAIVAKLSNKGAVQGKMHEYGGSCRNAAEANTSAELISKRLKIRQTYSDGSGNCCGFKAGYRFELENHFKENLNVSHLIISVNHCCSHSDSDITFVYVNQFETISGDSIKNYAPQRYSMNPRINGILTARIEANGSNHASLDAQGRYKVKFHFDPSEKNDCNGSKYIRLAQPYSGDQYGLHFPSHEGTEMVLACIDGDPNKPLGLGTVPNANTLSPVNDDNRFQNIIKTAGGNRLVLDDEDGKQKIILATSGMQNFCMDDENREIKLLASEQSQITVNDQSRLILIKNTGNQIKMSCGDKSKSIEISSSNGHTIKIDDEKNIISVKSNGGNKIDIDDSAMKIILSDGQNNNSVTIDSKNGLSLFSTGKITLNAKKDIEISGASVVLRSSQGNIGITAASELAISGNNINQKSSSLFNISGTKINTEGAASIEMKSACIGIESDGKIKVIGGTEAELSAKFITNVKGGVVNIN